MFERTRSKRNPGSSVGRFGSLALAALVSTAMACEQAPTGTEVVPASELSDPHVSASTTSMTKSSASFKTWHQGFQHGTDGWYGGETPGELGWCGSIEQVRRGEGSVAPSAGRAHAVVVQGACNEHWSSLFNIDDNGTTIQLVGVPWSPGPAFSALANPWPEGGYVMELDIYLDPSWTPNPLDPDTYVFEPGSDAFENSTVFSYSVTFFGLSLDPTSPFRYVQVPVSPGSGNLLVGNDEYPVTEAGWYTFRHVFSENGDGNLQIRFELEARGGGILHTEDVTSLYYTGSSPSDFAVTEVGTGYAWFTSISPGLELPIDEYRVRRGR